MRVYRRVMSGSVRRSIFVDGDTKSAGRFNYSSLRPSLRHGDLTALQMSRLDYILKWDRLPEPEPRGQCSGN